MTEKDKESFPASVIVAAYGIWCSCVVIQFYLSEIKHLLEKIASK